MLNGLANILEIYLYLIILIFSVTNNNAFSQNSHISPSCSQNIFDFNPTFFEFPE